MRIYGIILTAIAFGAGFVTTGSAHAQAIAQTKGDFRDAFRQLEESWPTPDEVRLASGAPGPDYWQQQADYDIKVKLDENKRRLSGHMKVLYTNHSPHKLRYIWLQLDQNRFRADSMAERSRTVYNSDEISYASLYRHQLINSFDGGYKIKNLKLADGRTPDSVIVDTLMRIDLPEALNPGEKVSFSLDWSYNIVEQDKVGARGGYECFTKEDEDGNCIFEIAQWYPRLVTYSDYEGWHNKPFLGNGEFTLEFGDYNVEIEVPADHIVSSTGVLQNADQVLNATQLERYKAAQSSSDLVFIVTPKEARAAEKTPSKETAIWKFSAKNVRDFAFASSRKFIWDGMSVDQSDAGGEPVLAMSFYPNEAEPLWSAYSTASIAHTIKVYSRFSFAYPYPVAQSVNGPVYGMEYPMITFNGPRPEKDDDGNLTYSRRTKYGLISVIIHEIGHIYFPMIVNSDERQWTWIDEGLNTFLQFVAEREWEENYPSRRGEPRDIIPYMRSQNQVPIMTQSDSILQFGNNAYAKPATALNILRETIMGRELFDHAFREFSRQWKFKRPTPSDFFRSMEDASGVDLDWFWRGWFYSTDHVDIAITGVKGGKLDNKGPEARAKYDRKKFNEEPTSLTIQRNADMPKPAEQNKDLRDFYNANDRFTPAKDAQEKYEKDIKELEDWSRKALKSDDHYYYVDFENHGGLVMPVILKMTYKNGKSKTLYMPAEIWRRNAKKVTKMIMSEREIVSFELDPHWETADINRSNNHFPPKIEPTRIEVYKSERDIRNLMQELDLRVGRDGLTTYAAIEEKDD